MNYKNTFLMQAICISLHFQFIKNFSFFIFAFEEEHNFKTPSGSALVSGVHTNNFNQTHFAKFNLSNNV